MPKNVKGYAFQYTNISWIKELTNKYPRVELMHTESECMGGDNKEEEALKDWQDYAAHTRAGTKLFTFWNMVLPEPRKNTWGLRQKSLVVIDTITKAISYKPSYAVAKFIGKNVQPGMLYIPAYITQGSEIIGGLNYQGLKFMESNLNNGEQLVAFSKSDGSAVILLYNLGDETKASIHMNKKNYMALLPAKSLVAIEVK